MDIDDTIDSCMLSEEKYYASYWVDDAWRDMAEEPSKTITI